MWTIYTFGDGDLIARILQAVALLVNGGLAGLLQVMALVGVAIVMGMWAANPSAWPRVITWFAGLLVVATGLLSVRVQVAVEDVADSRIPPQVVGDVPLLIALPASLSSRIAYQTTVLTTALQLNGEFGSGQTFLAPTLTLQLLLGANLQPGDLRANVINYLNWCVAPPNSHLVHPAGQMQNDPDLFGAIESSDLAQQLPTVRNGEIVGSFTCRDHYYTVLRPALSPLNPDADAGLRRTLDELKCQIFAGRRVVGGAGCVEDAVFWSSVDNALTALGLTASAGQDVLVTSLLAKLLREGEMDYAKRIMHEATAIQIANDGLIKQLEIQTKSGADAVKNGLVRQIRALADGTVLLGAPVMLAMSVTPLVWIMLGIYARLFAWLALWGPIQAVTHYVATTMAASDISGLTMMGGITASNLHQIFLLTVQTNAIGYDMLLAVPAVALAMAWGGVGALGGVLQSAGTRYAQTGQDVWRRVESGDSVLASSLSRGELLSGSLMRPPHVAPSLASGAAMPNAWVRDAWSSAAVSHGVGGVEIRTSDRSITTMRDGSTRIQSPTQDVSVTSHGNRTGWQMLDQAVSVETPWGNAAVQQGTYVKWTGHGAEVNLPSETDPVTGQTVAPVGRFAQDPQAPGGFGALQSKEWTVTQGSLAYQATQGKDGKIAYRITGATDLTVSGRDGQSRPVVAQVEMMQAVAPDGNGGFTPIGDAFGTVRYKDEQGNWHEEQGVVRQEPSGQRFVPLTGSSSNQTTDKRTQRIAIQTPDGKTVSGSMNIQTVTGPDGKPNAVADITLNNGLQYRIYWAGGVTFATVSGVLRGVNLTGGGVPDGAKGDLPLRDVPVSLNLPPDPAQWTPETLSQAIWQGWLQPFTTQVVDPEHPGVVAKLEIPALLPFGSSGGTVGGGDGQTDRPASGPTAFVGKYEVEATGGEILASGMSGIPGSFRVLGEMEQKGDAKHGRSVVIVYQSPDGQEQVLGAGEVTAKRNDLTGQWEVVSLKGISGINIVQNGQFVVDAVEAVRGVRAQVHRVSDPVTGNVITSTAMIGVTEQNLEQVKNAFKSGPVALEPGGTITIQNDGQVSYEGPAEILVVGQADGQPFEATVQGVAKFQGSYDPETGAMAFQAGQLSGRKEIIASSSQLSGPIADFFKTQAGQSGVVQLTVDPSGQAMTISGESGDTLTVGQNVRDINKGEFRRTESSYVVNPQTMALAASAHGHHGDAQAQAALRDVATDLMQTTNAQRGVRELEQAKKLAEFFDQQLRKQGEETGRGSANITMNPAKLISKLRKLNVFGIEIGGLFGSTEQDTYNLWVSAVRGAQEAAHREAAAAAEKVGKKGSTPYDKEYARVFTEQYGEKLHAVKTVFDEAVRGDSEALHGTDSLLHKSAKGSDNSARQANQAASQVIDGAAQSASGDVRPLTGQSSAGKVPDKPSAPASPAPSSSPAHKAGGPSPAEWQRILDRNPSVKGVLATAMDQFRKGDISESQFRELARSAFKGVYVGPPGSKAGKELDRAMEAARRAADEFVGHVQRTAAGRSAVPPATAASPGSSPLQTQPAPPTPPPAAANVGSEKGPLERAVEQRHRQERALDREFDGLRDRVPPSSPDTQAVRGHAARTFELMQYAERQIARYLDGRATPEQVLANVAQAYPDVQGRVYEIEDSPIGRWRLDFRNHTLSSPSP